MINILTKGDSFAEAVAFTGNCYPATAEVVSDARVARLPADHIVRCIRENSGHCVGHDRIDVATPAQPRIASRAAQGEKRGAAGRGVSGVAMLGRAGRLRDRAAL